MHRGVLPAKDLEERSVGQVRLVQRNDVLQPELPPMRQLLRPPGNRLECPLRLAEDVQIPEEVLARPCEK